MNQSAMRIVDSAVRLRPGPAGLDIEDWLARMDRCGISHAVVAPADAQVAVDNEAGNEAIAELVARHPGRLSGLAVANPWYGARAVALLRRAFDRGLVGLYVCAYRQGFRLTESVLNPVIEVCGEYDRPVYCYLATTGTAMPFQLAELARRFPSVQFILGHFGCADFAGYDAIPAARQADNISIETSCAWAGLVEAAIEAIGSERLLFGSGFPRSRPDYELAKVQTMGLAPEALERILGGNADRLWRLPA